ncbi:MAG: TonB-dependent receptor [Rhodospirillaceae bacterium]|nr:TonB-dependent receptor [Rhodospirillaceae bacterium]
MAGALSGVLSGAAATAAERAAVVEEITVTARKRIEVLSEVPQAVTVYRAEDLAGLAYTTSPEIAQQTPNLMWNSILGFSTPNIFLRGIGNTTFNANQAGPVGIHVDGVYQGSSVAYGFGLMDLDRIEILKGPQGTLFGRNTTGGVINFISARPDPAAGFNARASATYGRFDEINLDGAVGFNVSDDAAVRIAAQTLNRDGYVTNRTPASGIKRQGEVDIWASRAQFRVIAEAWDVLLTVRGGENHSDITPGKQLGVLCPAGVTVSRVGLCSDFFGFTDTPNLRESFTNIPSFDHVNTWGGGGTVTWTGRNFSVVAQTQYDANDRKLTNDSDVAPLSALKTDVKSSFHQFSQELRAASNPGRPFSWIAGANYYTDDLKAFQAFTLNAFGPGALSRFFPVEEGLASALAQQTESYAAFGEANYMVLPRVTVTGGVRWTHDRRTADTQAYIFDATGLGTAFANQPATLARALFPTIPPTHVSRAWGRWSGRGIVSYEAFDDILIYAGVAHGFKGGDFNGGALFSPLEANIVNPEYVTSYEIGVRGSTADKRLSFEAAGFYYDFTDQQVSVMIPGSAATLQTLSNAGKTRVKGLEAEVAFAPIDAMFLQLKTGLLDAEYVRFQLDPANPATNFAGNRTASSPEFSLAGIVRYTIPLRSGRVSAQTDFSFTGAHFYSADNNRALSQDGYWLMNGHLKYETGDGRYSVMAWMKNIADKKYFTAGLSNASFGFMEVFPGLPRTFGVTLAGKF